MGDGSHHCGAHVGSTHAPRDQVHHTDNYHVPVKTTALLKFFFRLCEDQSEAGKYFVLSGRCIPCIDKHCVNILLINAHVHDNLVK